MKLSEVKKSDVSKILTETKPESLTQISRALGFKGNISGALSKRIKYWYPAIQFQLDENAGKTNKAHAGKKPVKSVATSKPVKKTNIPRYESNPYRPGSNYSVAYDVLMKMGLQQPVYRKDLLAAYVRASGIPEKNAMFNFAVVLSPTEDGRFHKSAERPSRTYFVRRLENSMVQVVLRKQG